MMSPELQSRLATLTASDKAELARVLEELQSRDVASDLDESDLLVLLDEIAKPRPPTVHEMVAVMTDGERASIRAIVGRADTLSTNQQRRILAIASWLGDPDAVMRRVEEMRSKPGGSCEYDPDS